MVKRAMSEGAANEAVMKLVSISVPASRVRVRIKLIGGMDQAIPSWYLSQSITMQRMRCPMQDGLDWTDRTCLSLKAMMDTVADAR